MHTTMSEAKSATKEQQFNIHMFKVGSKLGKGQFGDVFIAQEKESKYVVALKVLHRNKIEKNGLLKQLKSESYIQKKLKHPNILRLHCMFSDERYFYLVLDFARGGDLFHELRKVQKFSEKRAATMLGQISDALAFCHSVNVIHRDIKPENIMLDRGKTCPMLSDFGWSIIHLADANGETRTRGTLCGTPDYLAPEMVCGERHDHRVDNWAVGVLCYEMLYGRAPFLGKTSEEQYDKIALGQLTFPVTAPPVSEGAQNLIRKLLQRVPEARLEMYYVKDDPWIQDNCSVTLPIQGAPRVSTTQRGSAAAAASTGSSTSSQLVPHPTVTVTDTDAGASSTTDTDTDTGTSSHTHSRGTYIAAPTATASGTNTASAALLTTTTEVVATTSTAATEPSTTTETGVTTTGVRCTEPSTTLTEAVASTSTTSSTINKLATPANTTASSTTTANTSDVAVTANSSVPLVSGCVASGEPSTTTTSHDASAGSDNTKGAVTAAGKVEDAVGQKLQLAAAACSKPSSPRGGASRGRVVSGGAVTTNNNNVYKRSGATTPGKMSREYYNAAPPVCHHQQQQLWVPAGIAKPSPMKAAAASHVRLGSGNHTHGTAHGIASGGGYTGGRMFAHNNSGRVVPSATTAGGRKDAENGSNNVISSSEQGSSHNKSNNTSRRERPVSGHYLAATASSQGKVQTRFVSPANTPAKGMGTTSTTPAKVPAANVVPTRHGKVPMGNVAPSRHGKVPVANVAPARHGKVPMANVAPARHGKVPMANVAPARHGKVPMANAAPSRHGKVPMANVAPSRHGKVPMANVASLRHGRVPMTNIAPHGKMAAGSVVPQGKVAVGSVVPQGKVAVGSVVPQGKVAVGSVVPQGKVAAGSVVPQGEVAAGSVVPQGKVAAGSVIPQGKVAAGSVIPQVKVAAGSVVPQGKVAVGRMVNQSKVAAGSVIPQGKVAAGSVIPQGKVAAGRVANQSKVGSVVPQVKMAGPGGSNVRQGKASGGSVVPQGRVPASKPVAASRHRSNIYTPAAAVTTVTLQTPAAAATANAGISKSDIGSGAAGTATNAVVGKHTAPGQKRADDVGKVPAGGAAVGASVPHTGHGGQVSRARPKSMVFGVAHNRLDGNRQGTGPTPGGSTQDNGKLGAATGRAAVSEGSADKENVGTLSN